MKAERGKPKATARGRRVWLRLDPPYKLPGHDGAWPSISVSGGTRSVASDAGGTRSLASEVSLQTTRKPRPRCGAFSLLEAVVSTLLIGLLLVAAMRTAGSSARASLANAHYAAAVLLAESLMSEVLALPYADPDESPVFGPEGAEETGDRSALDDVDDFHGWSASPPQEPDGTPLAGYEGWRRTVSVEFVNPQDLLQTSAEDKGIKRITVTVEHDGRTLAQLVGIRTNAH